MRKKTVTPPASWRRRSPLQPPGWGVPDTCEIAVTWKATTESAAIARSESKSGKRGFPGGGATAGSAGSDISAETGRDTARLKANRPPICNCLDARRLPAPWVAMTRSHARGWLLAVPLRVNLDVAALAKV